MDFFSPSNNLICRYTFAEIRFRKNNEPFGIDGAKSFKHFRKLFKEGKSTNLKNPELNYPKYDIWTKNAEIPDFGTELLSYEYFDL